MFHTMVQKSSQQFAPWDISSPVRVITEAIISLMQIKQTT